MAPRRTPPSTGTPDRNSSNVAFPEARLNWSEVSPGDESIVEPGPASLELAVRAAYPLLVDGALNADRGTAGNDQPDRRTPGEVLEAMRQRVRGVHQLAQALRDLKAEQSIRAVDDDGQILMREDGSGEQIVTDYYLRVTFPPPGKILARSQRKTPAELLYNSLVDFSSAMEGLKTATRRSGTWPATMEACWSRSMVWTPGLGGSGAPCSMRSATT